MDMLMNHTTQTPTPGHADQVATLHTPEPVEPSQTSTVAAFKEKGREVSAKANDLAEKARSKGSQLVDTGSNKIGSALASVSSATDKAQHSVERAYTDKISPGIANATDSLGKAADYLRSGSPSDFASDLGVLAKRHPKIAIGVLAGVAFLFGRKSKLG